MGAEFGIIAGNLKLEAGMKRKRSEVKAELMQKAELLIDQMLDWEEQTARPDLTQMEDVVLNLRKQLGEQLTLALVDQQEAKQPAAVRCAQCESLLRFKGLKDHRVESRVGGLPLARGYYYCETCQTGLFPPG